MSACISLAALALRPSEGRWWFGLGLALLPVRQLYGAWPLRAITLDCNHIPDAAMTLAATDSAMSLLLHTPEPFGDGAALRGPVLALLALFAVRAAGRTPALP